MSAEAGGWSTSARWEGCTKQTATPRIRHILRDVEEQNGLYRAHSNELIDRSRTDANLSFRPVVNADGSIGKERITSVQSVFDHLETGLATAQRWRVIGPTRRVKALDDAGKPVLDPATGKPTYNELPNPRAGERVPIALRADTAVCVEELFQLDPEFTGPVSGMTPEMRETIQALYNVWYADLVDQYGAENVLCISEHWDETSPHVSAFVMPLTADGDLNVKLFTTGKKKPSRTEARDAYVAKHDRLREALRQAGYDATFERITPRDEKGFPGKGAPLANFKRAAARATKAEREALVAERKAVEKFEADALKQIEEEDIDRKGEFLAHAHERTAELDAREATIVETEAAAAQTRAAATAVAERTVATARAEATRIRAEAETEKRRGYEVGLANGAREWERDHGASYRRTVRAEVEAASDRDAATADRTAAAAALAATQASLSRQREAERLANDDAEAAARFKDEITDRAGRLKQREDAVERERADLRRVREDLETIRAQLTEGIQAVVKFFRSVPQGKWTPGMRLGFNRFSEEQVSFRDVLRAAVPEVPGGPSKSKDREFGG